MNKTTEALKRIRAILSEPDDEETISKIREALSRFVSYKPLEKLTKAMKMAEEALRIENPIEQCIKHDAALSLSREALAESKPAPDGRIPKTVFTLEDIGKAAEMGREAGRIEALAEQDKREPVAFVKENPFCPEGRSDELTIYLPVGTALYTAPVSAEREWVELEPWQLCEIEERIGLPIDSHDFETIGNAYIAAFKEKNK